MRSFHQHSREWRTTGDTVTVEGPGLRPYQAVSPDYRPISRQRDNSALQSYLQPRLTPLKARPAISLSRTSSRPSHCRDGRPWHAVVTPGWAGGTRYRWLGPASPIYCPRFHRPSCPPYNPVHTPAPCPHLNQTSSAD